MINTFAMASIFLFFSVFLLFSLCPSLSFSLCFLLVRFFHLSILIALETIPLCFEFPFTCSFFRSFSVERESAHVSKCCIVYLNIIFGISVPHLVPILHTHFEMKLPSVTTTSHQQTDRPTDQVSE